MKNDLRRINENKCVNHGCVPFSKNEDEVTNEETMDDELVKSNGREKKKFSN
jgi:hypothetical protein